MKFKVGNKVRFLHGCISEAAAHRMEVQFAFGRVKVPKGTPGTVTGIASGTEIDVINVEFESWDPKLASENLSARGFHLDCFELEREHRKKALKKTATDRMDLLII